MAEIPVTPPGINETYRITSKSGKARMYKSPAATRWSADAALIVGSAAGDFVFNSEKNYALHIDFAARGYDVDAPIKLIVDTVTQKLGFDDRHITKLSIEKSTILEEGIRIVLREYDKC